jgi:hypothetical protein
MRKLVLAMSLSLDGFVGDGKGDWMFRTQSEAGRAFVTARIGGAGLHSRVMKVVMALKKLDIAKMKEAYNG